MRTGEELPRTSDESHSNGRALRAVAIHQGEGTLTLGRVASLPDAIYVAPTYAPR
jgi:hypothetical protein